MGFNKFRDHSISSLGVEFFLSGSICGEKLPPLPSRFCVVDSSSEVCFWSLQAPCLHPPEMGSESRLVDWEQELAHSHPLSLSSWS